MTRMHGRAGLDLGPVGKNEHRSSQLVRVSPFFFDLANPFSGFFISFNAAWCIVRLAGAAQSSRDKTSC